MLITFMFNSNYWLNIRVDQNYIDNMIEHSGVVLIYEAIPAEILEYFRTLYIEDKKIFRLEMLRDKIPFAYLENCMINTLLVSDHGNQQMTYIEMAFEKFEYLETMRLPL